MGCFLHTDSEDSDQTGWMPRQKGQMVILYTLGEATYEQILFDICLWLIGNLKRMLIYSLKEQGKQRRCKTVPLITSVGEDLFFCYLVAFVCFEPPHLGASFDCGTPVALPVPSM